MKKFAALAVIFTTIAGPALAQSRPALTPTPPTAPAPLLGTWAATDGSDVVRFAQCATAPTKLCATAIEHVPTDGEPSYVGKVVFSDVIQTAAGRYSGRFTENDQGLVMTLRLRTADVLEVRVCMGPFCDTMRYNRRRG